MIDQPTQRAREAGDAVRVTRIEAIPIALPIRRELVWRGLQGTLGRWVIVRVYINEALVGVGEATPLPDWGGDWNRHAGETPETVQHVVTNLLAPRLEGTHPFDIERALAIMDATVRGHVYAKAAVEMALYDLQGKLAGQPLYRLLGGEFRQGVPIAHMIGIMSLEEALEEADGALADGCRAFQVKGTGAPERDVALVAALRERVGDDTMLRLDANQGYRGLGDKHAINAVRALEAAGVDLVEQPTEGLRAMAAVRGAVDVPIVADESCWSAEDAVAIAEARAADALSIYVAKAGGVARARRIASLAECFGMPCDVNGSLESGIGTAASLHLALAMPAITLPAVIAASAPAGAETTAIAGRYYADDIVREPLAYDNGQLLAPEGAGLGIELDDDKLAMYAV